MARWASMEDEVQQSSVFLQLGWIPYWNLLPFGSELNRLNHDRLNIKSGMPTEVNQWLDKGEVTLAPCSSICLISKPGIEMALPLGVVADGPVMSVYLGFHKEHVELLEALRERRFHLQELCQKARMQFGYDSRSIARFLIQESQKLSHFPLSLIPGLKTTEKSASSATLAKILFHLWFGPKAYRLMVDCDVSQSVYTKRPMELLIGDEALQKKKQFHSILDLGTIWKEMTNLPFVFAVWQSKGACLNGWRRKILEVGRVAENRMHVDPCAYLPERAPLDEMGNKIPLKEYWQNIYYQLGPRELKGLLIFLCLARALKLVPQVDENIAKILRWQDLSRKDSLPVI